MKKLILSTTALLAVASLAACSGKQEVKTEASSSTEKTEKVTSKSSSSSKAEKTSSNTNSQTTNDIFPSDEELEKLKTVGDFKKCFAKIVDESNRLMTESMESLPESAKESFAQVADTLKETLAQTKEAFNKAVERYGDDNAEVPKEFRETFIEQLKDARDSAKDSSESPVDQDSDDEDSDSDE
ncbi:MULTISPECIES: hypothetical protein [Streptococcus]|jgi:hypothetical protein|uniref:hypothetical protein n=1 Tax=Streptococcus TaxID=1301 RepID=UPI001897621C|nr:MULTISPECIES: hypothetical protein [Streptococcus]MDB8644343.1 hypothetical protein [Streptococcus australis]MDB8649833.1 hypothetical protein [Streptococcus australis]QXW97407.1 hypothetical protein LPB404_04155 [Streptococcus rubneri]